MCIRDSRYTGTDSDIGVRKLAAFNATQHVSHMIIKSFAFSFLERNGFHAGYVIGYDRYDLPTGPCLLYTSPSKLVRTIKNEQYV